MLCDHKILLPMQDLTGISKTCHDIGAFHICQSFTKPGFEWRVKFERAAPIRGDRCSGYKNPFTQKQREGIRMIYVPFVNALLKVEIFSFPWTRVGKVHLFCRSTRCSRSRSERFFNCSSSNEDLLVRAALRKISLTYTKFHFAPNGVL